MTGRTIDPLDPIRRARQTIAAAGGVWTAEEVVGVLDDALAAAQVLQGLLGPGPTQEPHESGD